MSNPFHVKLLFSAKEKVEALCQQKVDVGFILDSSGSLRNEYTKEKDFLKAMAAQFDVGKSAQVGVITFSYYTELSIKMDKYNNINDLSKAVDDIPLMGSTTRIDKALRQAQSDMFANKNGGRFGVNKVLILLTDGSQTQDVGAEDPADIAGEIRKQGINMMTVGIGPGVNSTELARIAGGKKNVYQAESFDVLIGKTFLESVTKAGCEKGIHYF